MGVILEMWRECISHKSMNMNITETARWKMKWRVLRNLSLLKTVLSFSEIYSWEILVTIPKLYSKVMTKAPLSIRNGLSLTQKQELIIKFRKVKSLFPQPLRTGNRTAMIFLQTLKRKPKSSTISRQESRKKQEKFPSLGIFIIWTTWTSWFWTVKSTMWENLSA